MGSGLAGEVKKKGGEAVEVEAVRQGPANLGTAVATTAGELPLKSILHAVVMLQDFVVKPESVKKAVAAALRKANEAGLKSVAIAPMASEKVPGSHHEVVTNLVQSLFEYFLGEESSIEQVSLLARDRETTDAYRREFEQVLSRH